MRGQMRVPKKKALQLIDDKILQFEQILSEATYDTRYNEAYNLAYHGTEELLTELFSTEAADRFRISVTLPARARIWGDTDYAYELREYKNHIAKCISQLKVFREKIGNFWDNGESKKVSETTTRSGKDVFIVHGHDKASKESVARFVEKLGLHAIILHEQPNESKTIIEKFEDYSNVGFAIVILTPDDICGPRNEPDKQKLRARQNVIFELGYFVGKLGRSKVCALYKEDVDMPSDYNGVLYVPLDDNGAWQLKLAKEIKQAGIEVDLNKIIGFA
jgi:predicted nucleotide-binding protein